MFFPSVLCIINTVCCMEKQEDGRCFFLSFFLFFPPRLVELFGGTVTSFSETEFLCHIPVGGDECICMRTWLSRRPEQIAADNPCLRHAHVLLLLFRLPPFSFLKRIYLCASYQYTDVLLGSILKKKKKTVRVKFMRLSVIRHRPTHSNYARFGRAISGVSQYSYLTEFTY